MTAISIRLPSFVCCLIVIIFISKASGESDVTSQQFHYFCDQNNDRGNYTANSTYDTNLNTLLSSLTSNKKIDYGFYNSSYGQNTDKVYAIGLCRGDIKPDECRSCLNHAKANLTQLCPNRKEAIGWYQDEICMLRYSDRSIFGLKEIGPAYYAYSTKNATKVDQFNKVVKNLLNSLRSKAASGDSRLKYGAASAPGPDNQTIYGLVQCTPDLSGPDCDDCLVQSIKVLPDCCNDRIGARIIRPSCNLRYETSSRFYEPSTEAPSPSPSPSVLPSPTPSPEVEAPSPSLLPSPTPSPKAEAPSPSLSPSLLPSQTTSPKAEVPSPLLSPPPPSPAPSPEGMNNTSSTTVAKVPLMLLVGSFLFLSI